MRLLPTPARFLFPVAAATTTTSPVDSVPEPSLSYWTPELTGLTGGGKSLLLPRDAQAKAAGGMLIAYSKG